MANFDLDRMTDRAKHVLRLAEKESIKLGHQYVGSEHILLAMAKEESNVAATILKGHDLTYDVLFDETEELVGPVGDGAYKTKLLKRVAEILIQAAELIEVCADNIHKSPKLEKQCEDLCCELVRVENKFTKFIMSDVEESEEEEESDD